MFVKYIFNLIFKRGEKKRDENNSLSILIFQVYTESNPTAILLNDNIEVSAEAIEVKVKCDSFIDFGEVMCRKEYTQILTFQNIGKYACSFE